VKEIISKNI